MASRGDPGRIWRSGSYSRGSSSYRRPERGGRPKGQFIGQNAQQDAGGGLPPPVGPTLLEISRENLAIPLHDGMTSVSEVKYATSYNWLDTGNPTIKVPGKPPAWTPLAKPVKLPEDSGVYYRDQNAARQPDYPMEPAVRALLQQQPEFSSKEIDIVACGSTLGNLLRFVRKSDKTFRVLLEAVGDTVFFIRKESSPKETIPNVFGYGHTFPEAYTTWENDVKGSESHQRIIQYRFGGLSFLLRFESDGYLPDKVATATGTPESKATVTKVHDSLEADPSRLSDLIQTTAVAPKTLNLEGGLEVMVGGNENIPQSALFDLKTRSAKKRNVDTLSEELPRLWIAQIPNFILGYHESGVFKDIGITSTRTKILTWEQDNQEILEQFAVLLHELVDFARSRRNRTIEVRHSGMDKLELRAFTPEQSSAALSPEMRARWQKGPDAPERLQPHGRSQGNESEEENWDDANDGGVPVSDDGYSSEEAKDYTACSLEHCGYCGHCKY